jgi:uncharacterized membrane protein
MDALTNILDKLIEIHPLLGLAGIFACIFAPVVLLAVLTHRFVRGQKKSHEPEHRETAQREQSAAIAAPKASNTGCILTLITLILAMFLGCLIFPFLYLLRENSWRKIYPSPEKAAAILAVTDRIYIRTEGGETYSCILLTPKIDGSQPIACTKLPPDSVNIETLSRPRCQSFHPTPIPTPDKVIASDEVCEEYVDGAGFTKYVVRKDGSVWFWSTGYSMVGDNTGPLILAFMMGLGAVIGLVIWSVIGLAITVYRQVKKASDTKGNSNLDIFEQR